MRNLFFKSPPDSFAVMAPSERLSALRIGFLILIIIGLLAMVYVGYKLLSKPEITPVQKVGSLLDSLVPTAHAQATTPTPIPIPSISSAGVSRDLKPYLMLGLFTVLALVLFMSLGGVFFGRDPAKVSVASDILKMVLGFFIGAATGLIS